MSEIKLFVSDMDGTLFNSRTQVSDETVRALRALYDQGVILAFASGRMASDVPEPLLGIISYFIESDGGMVRDLATGQIIYHEAIDWRTASAYVTWLEKEGYFAYIHYGPRFITTNQNHDSRLSLCYPGVFDHAEGVDSLGSYIEKERICPEKIGTLFCDTFPVKQVLARKNDFPGATIIQTNTMAVEAHSPHTSKGDALRWLAGRLGISHEEIAAVGDNDNDITMLRFAGHSFAMGNATAGAMEAAGQMTATNDEGGVALVAQRFIH